MFSIGEQRCSQETSIMLIDATADGPAGTRLIAPSAICNLATLRQLKKPLSLKPGCACEAVFFRSGTMPGVQDGAAPHEPAESPAVSRSYSAERCFVSE